MKDDKNWIPKVKNESSIQYRGFTIHLAQDEETSEWLWLVGSSIGEDGRANTKAEVINQAKQMIDSVADR